MSWTRRPRLVEERLGQRAAWVWARVQDPRPLSDGTFPKKDDTRLMRGLGWSF